MATLSPRFSLLSLLPLFCIALLSLSVDARPGLPFHPCNTLIVSSYSFSLRPRNPNFLHPHHRRPEIFAVVTEFRPEFRPEFINPNPRYNRFFPRSGVVAFERPQEFEPLGFSSLRDRTKDILIVVASLLFGAACGALTAGTMYLIWSLFNHRHGSYTALGGGFSSDDDDDDDDDDDIFNPKKKGYVSIPAAPVPVPDSTSPAKESV